MANKALILRWITDIRKSTVELLVKESCGVTYNEK